MQNSTNELKKIGNSIIQSQTLRILLFFARIFDEFFSGFRAKFQKKVTSVAFQVILRKQIRTLPKILKSVKIIHSSQKKILFIRVLTGDPRQRQGDTLAPAFDEARRWQLLPPVFRLALLGPPFRRRKDAAFRPHVGRI